jgi:hypothetical protein
MHVANAYSLAETAVGARELGMELSAVAVFKRLRASEEWLRWLAERQRGGQQRLAVESQWRPDLRHTSRGSPRESRPRRYRGAIESAIASHV